MNEKYFCRCCLSEDCYKDMANEYYFGTVTENYCEMLLDIFNINITIDEEQRSLICEKCVFKLRDAAAYKQKVLEVQELLRSSVHLETNGKCTNINAIEEADNLDEFDNVIDYSFNENDIKWEKFNSDTSQKGKCFVIQLESKRQKKSINSKTYSLFQEKIKSEFEEETNQKNLLDTNDSLNSTRTIDENTSNINLQDNINTSKDQIENDDGTSDFENTDCQEDNVVLHAKPLSSCIDEDLDIGESSKSKNRKRNLKNIGDTAKRKKKKVENKKETSPTDLRMRYKRQNTLKLIQNSNLCLFKSFQNKFGCQHCNMRFTDLDQLKEHSFTHASTNIKSLVNRLKGFSCKNAEISDLKCNICSGGPSHCEATCGRSMRGPSSYVKSLL